MATAILTAEGLKKSFLTKDRKVEALKDVTLSVNSGEILAFLGPNGAGKTTTIKILAGLIEPDNGNVSLNGQDPRKTPNALETIGTVLEGNRNLYWRLTARENLQYFAALKGIQNREATLRITELLERFGLREKERSMVQTLSRGMQQKVAIAVSLIHRPKILLLDEPTLGLDVEAAIEVKKLIREIVSEGSAVILTTHQLELAEELSDRTSIIRDGKIIVEEPTKQLLSRFSGDSYTIYFSGSLNNQQISRMDKTGAFVVDDKVIIRGDTTALYSILEILKPVPLVKFEKDETNLTDVFLKLLKETNPEEIETDADTIFS